MGSDMDDANLCAALINCSLSLEQSWDAVRTNGNTQDSTEHLDAALAESFCLLEEFAVSPLRPDSGSASSVYQLMKNLFLIWYESNSLNEVTLKSWRHFSKIAELYPKHLDNALLNEFNRLLVAYCSEGLDALHMSVDSLGDTIGAYLEQHNSTIKLIGFFTLRLSELLARFRASLQPEVAARSVALVLRYVSVLHFVGLYSDAVAAQTAKTLEYLRAAVRRADMPAQDVPLILSAVLHTISTPDVSAESVLQSHVGAARYAMSVVEQCAEEQLGGDEPIVTAGDAKESIALLIGVVQGLCLECAGQVQDGVVLSLLQRAAQAIAQALSSAQPPEAVYVLVSACCHTDDYDPATSSSGGSESAQQGVSAVSRMLLGGALACFEEAPQRDIVQVVWHLCSGALLRNASEVDVNGAVGVLRAVLLVAGSGPRRELLGDMLALAGLPLAGPTQHAPHTQCAAQSVKELVLSTLPVAYLLSLEGDPCQELTVRLLGQSVASIESYAGAPGSGSSGQAGSSAHSSSVMEIGSAVAVLCASSGYLDTVNILAHASQSASWRQAKEPILGNISLGTALLRWISSLSDHIKVLLPSADPTRGLNMHRVGRVEGLVSTLTALVQCLWSHAVPRAVQGILARAAKCCAETALSLLTSQNEAHYGDGGASSIGVELVARVVTKLLHCVGSALKIIGSPSFSEKSIEVVKEVYSIWHRVCGIPMQLHSTQGGWQDLVRMLSSLQQFANSLPAPLKPRARELVDPALVGVIQARALGRTFSMAQRCDVPCSLESDREVTAALGLGVRAVRLEAPDTAVGSDVPYEDNGITYNKQDHLSEGYAGYPEQGDENKRDFEDYEENEEVYPTEVPATKRQRSGTQGSQDGESSGGEFGY